MKWLEKIHRLKWDPTKHAMICSDHFDEKIINRNSKLVTLKHDAIPTRLLESKTKLGVVKHDHNYCSPIEPVGGSEGNVVPDDATDVGEEVEETALVNAVVHDHDYCCKIMQPEDRNYGARYSVTSCDIVTVTEESLLLKGNVYGCLVEEVVEDSDHVNAVDMDVTEDRSHAVDVSESVSIEVLLSFIFLMIATL